MGAKNRSLGRTRGWGERGYKYSFSSKLSKSLPTLAKKPRN